MCWFINEWSRGEVWGCSRLGVFRFWGDVCLGIGGGG